MCATIDRFLKTHSSTLNEKEFEELKNILCDENKKDRLRFAGIDETFKYFYITSSNGFIWSCRVEKEPLHVCI